MFALPVHSAWVSRLLAAYGDEVLVANPRQVWLIHAADGESDRIEVKEEIDDGEGPAPPRTAR